MKNDKKKIEYIQTNYGLHQCVFEPDVKGFMVTVPGLQGVVTWGKNLTHARVMVREAIELCIECIVEDALRQKHTIRQPVSVSVA
ncbi:MAG: type II toxin-antitoxin system HicB family antitoxin [bacterium]|nr:type II toxin-antitoxin system HicB family antitoxin [bacterium]